MAIDIGGAIGRLTGIDITPGFNLSRDSGGAVPFVSKQVDYNPTVQSTPDPNALPQGRGTSAAIVPDNTAANAAASAAAAKAASVAKYGTTANGYVGAAKTGLRDVGNTYDDKTRAFIDSIRTGQEGINTDATTNQLNLKTSMQNIVKTIQNGVRSGGVQLAGMNASDSGAADAMARAWAQTGNNQSADATGQAAQVDEQIGKSQAELARKKAEGEGSLNTYRDTEVDRVKNDLASKLAVLSAEAGANGAGGSVNTGVTDQVVAEAIQRLAGIDASRAAGVNGVQALTPEQAAAEAARLASLGQGGTAFDVAGPEVSWQGGASTPQAAGATAALPIYTRPKDQQLATV